MEEVATNQLVTSQGVQGTTEYNYGVTGEESEMVETAEHLASSLILFLAWLLPGVPGEHPDPVPCLVATWNTWGSCSRICGGGTMSRRREIAQQPMHDGKACPVLEKERACNTELCEGKI